MPYNLLYVQTCIHGCMHIMYNYKYTCIYILMNIHPFIPSFQILMSVVMEHTNAPKYTNGSFICECYDGYELDFDNVTCNGMHI